MVNYTLMISPLSREDFFIKKSTFEVDILLYVFPGKGHMSFVFIIYPTQSRFGNLTFTLLSSKCKYHALYRFRKDNITTKSNSKPRIMTKVVKSSCRKFV